MNNGLLKAIPRPLPLFPELVEVTPNELTWISFGEEVAETIAKVGVWPTEDSPTLKLCGTWLPEILETTTIEVVGGLLGGMAEVETTGRIQLPLPSDT